jgi:ubiquinone biosynthesis monooxygenase Coq7
MPNNRFEQSRGYALGLVTGLCGRASIAATTVAVEGVVLRHLEVQLAALRGVDDAAGCYRIHTCVRAISSRQGRIGASQGVFWPNILRPIVGAATEAVIWLGMKL